MLLRVAAPTCNETRHGPVSQQPNYRGREARMCGRRSPRPTDKSAESTLERGKIGHSMRPSEHSDVKCERKPTDGTRDITMLAWVPINTNRNRFHNNDSATGKAHRLRCGGGHARMGVQPTCDKAEEWRGGGGGGGWGKRAKKKG
jgi:hypothetical protein